jgi:tRNA pseudouridine38-40 synthase
VNVRLRLDLSYDGTDFCGWARQPELRTVAQVVEEALTTVLRLDGPPQLTVAGRTDSGVHALGQVAHADVPGPVDVDVLARRLAGVFPDDLRLRAVRIAAPGFHARFSALGRHYRYRVDDGTPNPLRRHDTVGWPRSLHPDAMQKAAAALIGQHNFAAYCKPRDGATTIRTVRQFDVERDSESVVVMSVHADAFCHHQVRSMVGALLAVGEGRRPDSWPEAVLNSRYRNSLVNVAPAHGLTLMAVDYPPDDQLQARAELTRQRRA